MTAERRDDLLARYTAGELSAAEENELLSAAFDDQEIFDALTNQQVMRELLAEPASRQILLGQPVLVSRWEWLKSLLTPPKLWAAAGAAAAVLVVVAVLPRRAEEPVFKSSNFPGAVEGA